MVKRKFEVKIVDSIEYREKNKILKEVNFMKRFLMLLAVVLAIALIFSAAELKAATNQNIWITVSCIGTNSIIVVNTATTNWSVLNKPFTFLTNRDVATVVSNDGRFADGVLSKVFRLIESEPRIEVVGPMGILRSPT